MSSLKLSSEFDTALKEILRLHYQITEYSLEVTEHDETDDSYELIIESFQDEEYPVYLDVTMFKSMSNIEYYPNTYVLVIDDLNNQRSYVADFSEDDYYLVALKER